MGENPVAYGVMFPGQGAQFVGMGKALYEESETARRTFEEADEALRMPLSRRIFEGPESELEATEIQQPAILTVSIAAWRTLREQEPGFRPGLGVGLSLGEYSAYVAADSLDFADGVRLTRIRGRAMQEAVALGTGGMMAVLGLEDAVVERLAAEAGGPGNVEPANYNAPGQVVVAGLNAGLARLEGLVQAAGGRAVRLKVSAPFHCSLLAPAREVLAQALSEVAFRSAAFPVLANVDAEPCSEPEEILPRLIEQVSRPVRFSTSVVRAHQLGVSAWVEVGPGKTLASLVKKIDRRMPTLAVADPASLARTLEQLAGAKL